MLSNFDYLILHLKRIMKENSSAKDDLRINVNVSDTNTPLAYFPFEDSEDYLAIAGEGIYLNQKRIARWEEIVNAGWYSLDAPGFFEDKPSPYHWITIDLKDGTDIELPGLSNSYSIVVICRWIARKNYIEGRRRVKKSRYFLMKQSWLMAILRYPEFKNYTKFVRFFDGLTSQHIEVQLSTNNDLLLNETGVYINNEFITSWDDYGIALWNYEDVTKELERSDGQIVETPPFSIDIFNSNLKYIYSISGINKVDYTLFECLVNGFRARFH
ncbi:MAG: hypothetical protein Q8933_20745 [Bacteroidota bacterium]|nr:hypothetical protein [Bacteroidota bacterium]MDP4197179.1 hypothetical protein [Bacteroidota bacterium]